MTFQPAPNCVELVVRGTIGFKPVANVLNFWKPTTYNLTDIQDLADAANAQTVAHYLPIMGNGVAYSECFVRGLSTIIDISAANASGAGAGSAAGVCLPSNSSFVVTLRTGFTGRSARGRFYAWPTGSGNQVDAGTVSIGYGDAVVTLVTAYKTAAAALGFQMVVLSRQSGGVRPATATHIPVTLIEHRNLELDSQRRRLPTGH